MGQLEEIFQLLNHGIEIEYLDIRDKEFLCKKYGEEWKSKVLGIIKAEKVLEFEALDSYLEEL